MTQSKRFSSLYSLFAFMAILFSSFSCSSLSAAESSDFPDPATPNMSWFPENSSINHAAATRPDALMETKNRFHVAEGKASYYGKEFNGRKTASGEYFNLFHFTAAHRSLAFGTNVKVTNLDNGKNVIVRINDRGPFRKGRIIDVSQAAARKIGLYGTGTANVRIEAYN
jgi:rare lipoprotein A